MSARTFKVDNPPMRGDDIRAWQEWLNGQLAFWRVDFRVGEDGQYGALTRSLTASVCHGLGLASASEAMRDGVTPELRVKLRNKRLSPDERARYHARAEWRELLRERHMTPDVSPPLAKVLEDSWGYVPGVHDGIDLISRPRAAGLAICKARVVRADNGGWWGKNPTGDVRRGDGVVILRSLIDDGPFSRGLNFVYGHAEHVRVNVGEEVEAGQVICEAGFANAWHFHFCVNRRDDARGVGDHDPRRYLDYAQRHG